MEDDRYDLFIRCGLLIGMFVFVALGVLALDRDPDFIFDRFLSAGFFLFFFFFYKRLGLTLSTIIIGTGALILHHLKLYGGVYLGFEFDMIMHFVGAFAVSLIVYQYLSTCEGIGCSSRAKLALLSIFIVAGLGTLIEIVEYFGYAKLPSGEGLLHYGLGDEGDWADSVSDMLFNLFGAIAGAISMLLARYVKRRNVKNLKLFLASLFV